MFHRYRNQTINSHCKPISMKFITRTFLIQEVNFMSFDCQKGGLLNGMEQLLHNVFVPSLRVQKVSGWKCFYFCSFGWRKVSKNQFIYIFQNLLISPRSRVLLCIQFSKGISCIWVTYSVLAFICFGLFHFFKLSKTDRKTGKANYCFNIALKRLTSSISGNSRHSSWHNIVHPTNFSV